MDMTDESRCAGNVERLLPAADLFLIGVPKAEFHPAALPGLRAGDQVVGLHLRREADDLPLRIQVHNAVALTALRNGDHQTAILTGGDGRAVFRPDVMNLALAEKKIVRSRERREKAQQ